MWGAEFGFLFSKEPLNSVCHPYSISHSGGESKSVTLTGLSLECRQVPVGELFTDLSHIHIQCFRESQLSEDGVSSFSIPEVKITRTTPYTSSTLLHILFDIMKEKKTLLIKSR